MALELMLRSTNFYPYRTCAELPINPIIHYPPYCTGLLEYRESVSLLDSFVYDASRDRYTMITWHSMVDYPSWSIWGSVIHPETGALESHALVDQFAVEHAWTSTMWNGGLNKRYVIYLGGSIMECSRIDGIVTPAQLANPILTTTQIPVLAHSQGAALVCPERKLVTLLDYVEGIAVWDYSNAPGLCTRLSRHPFTENNPWSAGYEDDQSVWVLFSDSAFGSSSSVNQSLVKYNYRYNRFDLLTELQRTTGADRMAMVAFDNKRKKLAAVRFKADSANGAPNNAFEIYTPRPAMFQITVPVNVKALVPDKRMLFVASLLGTKAEAGGLKTLDISNVEVDGVLSKTEVATQANGAAQFEYQTETAGLTDTITVSYDETKVTT